LSPTIEQACNVQGASWVKRKNMCMWIAKAFQAFALGDAWKKFAQLD
jgi:hypothetical protein